ncbi:hypothetical protein PPERSA_10088 [Pseudocohnilembus persalinus]|uniref:Uncharacterized protein n=1 Tax=Pseudocohnilembus persalinus TaxID=266149 RepID=A0A0V0QJQ7_PSEPJ|nr:hypothetical protein PPERSA_10088 [Pseudocohnilembus persalinus]|eukprot:KRX02471.1 hypothetical protein PPERSA_10088 [Pseudocohnilembus persalinus]
MLQYDQYYNQQISDDKILVQNQQNFKNQNHNYSNLWKISKNQQQNEPDTLEQNHFDRNNQYQVYLSHPNLPQYNQKNYSPIQNNIDKQFYQKSGFQSVATSKIFIPDDQEQNFLSPNDERKKLNKQLELLQNQNEQLKKQQSYIKQQQIHPFLKPESNIYYSAIQTPLTEYNVHNDSQNNSYRRNFKFYTSQVGTQHNIDYLNNIYQNQLKQSQAKTDAEDNQTLTSKRENQPKKSKTPKNSELLNKAVQPMPCNKKTFKSSNTQNFEEKSFSPVPNSTFTNNSKNVNYNKNLNKSGTFDSMSNPNSTQQSHLITQQQQLPLYNNSKTQRFSQANHIASYKRGGRELPPSIEFVGKKLIPKQQKYNNINNNIKNSMSANSKIQNADSQAYDIISGAPKSPNIEN